MPASRIALSTFCPSWKGTISSSQVTALRRGITREQERFRGRPFVLIRLLDGTDYDGFKTDLELVAGFTDEDTAIRSAREQAEAALVRALAQGAHSAGAVWAIVSPVETSLQRESLGTQVERVALAQFKVRNDNGFCMERSVFQILHVSAPEIIGPELFTALGWEFELWHYLLAQGVADARA